MYCKKPIKIRPLESPIKLMSFHALQLNGVRFRIAAMIYPLSMSIETILAEIDAEIARLTQVRSLLAGTRTVSSSGPK